MFQSSSNFTFLLPASARRMCPKEYCPVHNCVQKRMVHCVHCPQINNSKLRILKETSKGKLKGIKNCMYSRLKTVCTWNVAGLCTLIIFSYEISLSCGTLENTTVSPCLDMATLSIGAYLWDTTYSGEGLWQHMTSEEVLLENINYQYYAWEWEVCSFNFVIGIRETLEDHPKIPVAPEHSTVEELCTRPWYREHFTRQGWFSLVAQD